MKEHLTLRTYQARGSSVIDKLRSAVVAFPYGAGKTITALHAIEGNTNGSGLDAIVCCPSHVKYSWEEQIKSSLCEHLILQNRKDLQRWISNGCQRNLDQICILLVSHDEMRSWASTWPEIVKVTKPRALVVDESTAFKNPKAGRTKAVHKLSAMLDSNALRVLLAGRLAPQDPTHVWAQFEILYPGRNPLGHTYYKFTYRYFTRGEYSNYALRRDKQQEFIDIVRASLIQLDEAERLEHLEKSGNLAIQPVSEHYDLTKAQIRCISHLEETWSLPSGIDDTGYYVTPYQTYMHTISLATKTRQIYNGWYYLDEEADQDESNVDYSLSQKVTEGRSRIRVEVEAYPPKVTKLLNIVQTLLDEKPTRQLVIWYWFAPNLDVIKSTLAAINVTSITSTSNEDLQRFANSKAQVAVLQLSKARGLNQLVAADTMIFYDGTWDVEQRDQAIHRLARPGQKSQIVTVIDMVSGQGPDTLIRTAMVGRSKCEHREIQDILRNYYGSRARPSEQSE